MALAECRPRVYADPSLNGRTRPSLQLIQGERKWFARIASPGCRGKTSFAPTVEVLLEVHIAELLGFCH